MQFYYILMCVAEPNYLGGSFVVHFNHSLTCWEANLKVYDLTAQS